MALMQDGTLTCSIQCMTHIAASPLTHYNSRYKLGNKENSSCQVKWWYFSVCFALYDARIQSRWQALMRFTIQ